MEHAPPFGRFGRVGRALPMPVRVLLRYAPVWIVALQAFTTTGSMHGSRDWALAVVLVAVIGAAWTWLLFGPGPVAADQVALIVAVGAAGGLTVLNNAGEVYVVGYATMYVGPFFYGLPAAAASSVAAVVAVGVCTALVGKADLVGGIGTALGAFFFGLAALSWGRVMREGQRNAELVEELRASREAERQNAVAAERARLARELHDVLAHTLSSLALHLESTRALARKRDVAPEVEDRLAEAVRLARAGLDEARAAVDALRFQELPGPERLPELVERFATMSGIDCRFVQNGQPRALPPEAQIALFRAAQEGLSNIAKHAHPSRVEVRVDWLDDAVTLRVADHAETRIDTAGAAGEPAGAGGGHGLRGMRERAELAGGRLSAGPTEDGFALELSLPA